jgi:hypothetical protein
MKVVTYTLLLHPCVARLAVAMQNKLWANTHKGGWHKCALRWLRARVVSETLEMVQAPDEDVWREAADVANFAMMYADRRTGRTRKENET